MKTIIYLDQSYVSNFTKARLGVKVYPDIAHYRDLNSALREAVHGNVSVCPISTSHVDESLLDTRLALGYCRTIAELSYGTELLFWGDILQVQVIEALHRYLGVQPPATAPAWKKAFNKDPHRHFHPLSDAMRTSTAEAFVDLHRGAKILHEREGVPPPIGDFREQKRGEAFITLREFYVRLWENILRGNLGVLATAGWQALPKLTHVYFALTGRKPGLDPLLRFFASEEAINVPFVDICSSLRAGMVIWGQKRKSKGSDLNDVLIAAAVLPCCNVFTTDRYVKDLVHTLKLDKQYNVSVFSPRMADVLALTKVVRALPSQPRPVSPPPALPA